MASSLSVQSSTTLIHRTKSSKSLFNSNYNQLSSSSSSSSLFIFYGLLIIVVIQISYHSQLVSAINSNSDSFRGTSSSIAPIVYLRHIGDSPTTIISPSVPINGPAHSHPVTLQHHHQGEYSSSQIIRSAQHSDDDTNEDESTSAATLDPPSSTSLVPPQRSHDEARSILKLALDIMNGDLQSQRILNGYDATVARGIIDLLTTTTANTKQKQDNSGSSLLPATATVPSSHQLNHQVSAASSNDPSPIIRQVPSQTLNVIDYDFINNNESSSNHTEDTSIVQLAAPRHHQTILANKQQQQQQHQQRVILPINQAILQTRPRLLQQKSNQDDEEEDEINYDTNHHHYDTSSGDTPTVNSDSSSNNYNKENFRKRLKKKLSNVIAYSTESTSINTMPYSHSPPPTHTIAPNTLPTNLNIVSPQIISSAPPIEHQLPDDRHHHQHHHHHHHHHHHTITNIDSDSESLHQPSQQHQIKIASIHPNKTAPPQVPAMSSQKRDNGTFSNERRSTLTNGLVQQLLPQMQIKSRFNQGCVGGTKCQFFAFCWMSGGSLGASCGLLMTCCVTPSRTEIQPVFYGPVVNDPYCGRSTSKISRIVGGSDASFGQFPWQAFVQVGGSRCGGALVSSRHVVTAGHCVARLSSNPSAPIATRSQHSPSSIKVTLGDYILNSDIESLPHEVFSVVDVLLHPNFRFTPQADRYDVAVLVLDRSAQYKDNIKPICLPQKDAAYIGRVAYVAGWGALQAGSKLRPKVLQHVAVPVIENNVCENWHRRKGIDIRIYDEMMCAGYELGQRDACQGDSGGPLMLNQFGVWYLVGIVSAGYSCAKQYQPGIYHRVSSSSDWISSNVYQQSTK